MATAPREGKRPRRTQNRAESLNVVVAGGGIAGVWQLILIVFLKIGRKKGNPSSGSDSSKFIVINCYKMQF